MGGDRSLEEKMGGEEPFDGLIIFLFGNCGKMCCLYPKFWDQISAIQDLGMRLLGPEIAHCIMFQGVGPIKSNRPSFQRRCKHLITSATAEKSSLLPQSQQTTESRSDLVAKIEMSNNGKTDPLPFPFSLTFHKANLTRNISFILLSNDITTKALTGCGALIISERHD